MSLVQRRVLRTKCDICGYRDGHKGLFLLTCEKCGLKVHKECYGSTRDDAFVCLACKAVGKSFQVEGRNKDGSRLKLLQKERPTQCELCFVKDGIHAMHPLYDNHGQRGRQIKIMEDPEPRLAWVHSLCAFYIGQKIGVVYGCTADGYFDDGQDDENAEDDEDDDRSINPDLEGHDDVESIHHFVYSSKKKGKKDTPWTKAIREHQHDLKCYLCGQSDKPKSILRIAMQCSANNPDEMEEFNITHCEMGQADQCTMSLHVGCAKWGHNPRQIRRVFFFPGLQGKTDSLGEPAAEAYCDAHAKDVYNYHHGEKQTSSNFVADNPRKKQMGSITGGKAPRRPTNERSPLPTQSLTRRKRYDDTVLPSLERKVPSKKRKSSTGSSKVSVQGGNIKPTNTKGTKKRRLDKVEQDAPGKDVDTKRPAVEQQKKVLAPTDSRKSVSQKEAYWEQLKTDVIDHLPRDTVKVKEFVKEKREHWKQQLSHLDTTKFKDLWKRVKEAAAILITQRNDYSKKTPHPSDKSLPPSDNVAPPGDEDPPPSEKDSPPGDKNPHPSDQGSLPSDKVPLPSGKDVPTSDKVPPPGGKVIPPSNKVPPPSNKNPPSDKVLPPSDKVPLPSRKNSPPSNKVPLPSRKNSPPSDNVPPPSRKVIRPGGNNSLPSDKVCPSSDKIPPPSSKVHPPSDKVPLPSGKNPPPSRKVLPPSDKVPPPDGKNSLPSDKVVPSSGKNSLPSDMVRPPSDKVPPPSSKVRPPSDKVSLPSCKVFPPSDKVAPHSDNNPPASGKSPPPNSQNSPPSGKSSPPSCNRWSYLTVIGPDCNGETFEFGEWDTMEMV